MYNVSIFEGLYGVEGYAWHTKLTACLSPDFDSGHGKSRIAIGPRGIRCMLSIIQK